MTEARTVMAPVATARPTIHATRPPEERRGGGARGDRSTSRPFGASSPRPVLILSAAPPRAKATQIPHSSAKRSALVPENETEERIRPRTAAKPAAAASTTHRRNSSDAGLLDIPASDRTKHTATNAPRKTTMWETREKPREAILSVALREGSAAAREWSQVSRK